MVVMAPLWIVSDRAVGSAQSVRSRQSNRRARHASRRERLLVRRESRRQSGTDPVARGVVSVTGGVTESARTDARHLAGWRHAIALRCDIENDVVAAGRVW